jgi:ATP-dependent RNA helicase DDX19/DBP5
VLAVLIGWLFTVRLIKTIRKKNPEVQLLLFSATFNDRVKEFAIRIAPNANQVMPGLRQSQAAVQW